MKVLKFFSKNEMIKDADYYLRRFDDFVESTDRLIELQIDYAHQDHISKLLTNFIDQIQIRRTDHSIPGLVQLVKILIETQQYIKDNEEKIMTNDTRIKLKKKFKAVKSELSRTLENIKRDYEILPKFAF